MDDRTSDVQPGGSWRAAISPRAMLLIAALLLCIGGAALLFSGSASGQGNVRLDGGSPLGTATAGDTAGVAANSRETASARATPTRVIVHVLGAVGAPGLVRLHDGARVADAIEAAGGAKDAADLTRVNLARVVVDGERLYVPAVGEAAPPAVVAGDGAGAGGISTVAGQLIDLNTADAAALETLPGIGPALAQRILTWRQQHGAFRGVDDLLEVAGIGETRLAELRDLVRI